MGGGLMANGDYDGPERRAGAELILMQLTQLSEGQTRLETAIERVSTEQARSMLELERSMGKRVTDLEKWQAAQQAAERVRQETRRETGDDRGAQLVKLAILALSCLAAVLYFVANGGHL